MMTKTKIINIIVIVTKATTTMIMIITLTMVMMTTTSQRLLLVEYFVVAKLRERRERVICNTDHFPGRVDGVESEIHEGIGKSFVQPKVVPPFHSHHVSKPLKNEKKHLDVQPFTFTLTLTFTFILYLYRLFEV